MGWDGVQGCRQERGDSVRDTGTLVRGHLIPLQCKQSIGLHLQADISMPDATKALNLTQKYNGLWQLQTVLSSILISDHDGSCDPSVTLCGPLNCTPAVMNKHSTWGD